VRVVLGTPRRGVAGRAHTPDGGKHWTARRPRSGIAEPGPKPKTRMTPWQQCPSVPSLAVPNDLRSGLAPVRPGATTT